MEHREYACQPAGMLLQGSRDNDQRNTTTFSSELITTTLENKEMYERSMNSRI